jgi:hypothetical protein
LCICMDGVGRQRLPRAAFRRPQGPQLFRSALLVRGLVAVALIGGESKRERGARHREYCYTSEWNHLMTRMNRRANRGRGSNSEKPKIAERGESYDGAASRVVVSALQRSNSHELVERS